MINCAFKNRVVLRQTKSAFIYGSPSDLTLDSF